MIPARLRLGVPLAILGAALALAAGCSTAKKKTAPELARLEGRKVALVDIDGEETARRVVEVALINQLANRGTFILVSKQDVEAARAAPDQSPTDWKGLARRSGAEFALRAKVLEFSAETREGYSSEMVEDSQLAQEQGESARKSERIFKAKAIDGKVRVQLEFTELSPKDASDAVRVAVAEKTDRVSGDEKDGAIHLPPKLRFLENLTNEAFREFFERYN